MSTSSSQLKVIIDTSFLLPTLGMDAGKPANRGLKKLDEIEAEIYYSRFSILESLWVAAGSIQDSGFDGERFTHGMRSIVEGERYQRLDETSEVFNRALELYKSGHVDIIDNILYASSLLFGLKLLTVDKALRDFIEEKSLEMTLISVDELG